MPERRVRKRTTEESVESSTVSVYRTVVGEEDSEEKETINVKKFVTEPAYVRVNAGVTINLGDYQSMRIDVSVSVPCYVEEIERVEREVADFVAARLADEQKEYGVSLMGDKG